MLKINFVKKIAVALCFMIIMMNAPGARSFSMAEKTDLNKRQLQLFNELETNTFLENLKKLAREKEFSFILPTQIGNISQAIASEKPEILEVLGVIAKKANAAIFQKDSLFVFSHQNKDFLNRNFPGSEASATEPLSLEEADYDLRDLISVVSRQFKVNIIHYLSVRGNVYISVKTQPWHLVLKGALGIFGFDCRQVGNVWYVGTPEQIAFMTEGMKEPVDNVNRLRISLKDCSLQEMVFLVAHHGQKDYIISRQVVGQMSNDLDEIDSKKGVASLVRSRGFDFSEINGIWHISSPLPRLRHDGKSFESGADRKIPIVTFFSTPVEKVLDFIAKETNLEIFISEEVGGKISLRLTNRSADEILRTIIAANNWRMKKKGERVYLMGEDESGELNCCPLLDRLKSIPSENVEAISDFDLDKDKPLAFIESEKDLREIVYPRLKISGVVVSADRQCALLKMQSSSFIAEPGKEYFNFLKILEIQPRGIKAFSIKTQKEVFYRF